MFNQRLNFAALRAFFTTAATGPQNTVIVVCCGNKIKDRQLEQSKHVHVVTTDNFDDLKIAYSAMSSSTCEICGLLISFHFLLSHKYVSVKVIVMAQSFPAICRGVAVCTVLNICDVEHVGMSEELTRMPNCSNSSVVHPFPQKCGVPTES